MCQFPFGSLSVDEKGLAPCCWSKGLLPHRNSLQDPYNSPPFQKVREQLNRGEFPESCSACEVDESNSKTSLRQRLGVRLFSQQQTPITDSQEVRHMDITLDRVCPLACRMCSTLHSSSWDAVYDRLKENQHLFSREVWDQIEMNNKESHYVKGELMTRQDWFQNLLSKSLRTCSSINLTGGEPLAHPDHGHLLDRFLGNDVKFLTYHTSLNAPERLISGFEAKWNRFQSVNFKVSVDDIENHYDRFRVRGQFEKVIKNMLSLKKMEICGIEVNIVVQSWNISRILKIYRYWQNFGEVKINLKPVDGPEFFKTTVLPSAYRPKIIKQLLELAQLLPSDSVNHRVIEQEIQSLETLDHSHFFKDWTVYNDILNEFVGQ